jgi:hypothetical protein
MLFDRPANSTCTTTSDLVQDGTTTGADGDEQNRKSISTTATQVDSIASSMSTLVHRPRQPDVGIGFETDSSSEDEGFSIVHRPKLPAVALPEDLMSSPEIIPSNPIDILALTGSNYSDDEDWDML